jgi:hypothetical protein
MSNNQSLHEIPLEAMDFGQVYEAANPPFTDAQSVLPPRLPG